MKNFTSFSSAETKKIAGKLAKKILGLKPAKHAKVFGLVGDLGSGKTTFVQGFLGALGVKKKVTSPTFVLIKRHPIRSKSFRHVHHVDSYRLKKGSDLKIIDLERITSDPGNIVLVEWAEKARKLLPKDTVWISFAHGKKENERRIVFSR